MQDENGQQPRAVADIGMRIVVEVGSYGAAGTLMDDVQEAVDAILAGYKPKAKFEFISFNTHPCKAMQMDDALIHAARAMPEDRVPW